MAVISKSISRGFALGGRLLSRIRGRRFLKGTARNIDLFRRRLENVNFDPRTNGEVRVMKLLQTIDPQCVFDVGAHEGDWSRLFRRLHPRCAIHAFEIVPETFQVLETTTAGWSHLTLNNVGLSDKSGTVEIHLSDQSSLTSTAYPIPGLAYHESYYSRTALYPVLTGAEYMARHDITSIDFLKIDVEGMDMQVIKGFGDQLDRVQVIQFEYGIFNIASRALLHDFHTLLTAAGFAVGKIYPRFVDFFEYHYDHEDFLGNNYLAVRRQNSALIVRLAAR